MTTEERASLAVVDAAEVEIDLAAIASNYGSIKDRHPEKSCGAVVKADGYGLGLRPIMQTLLAAGCRDFFVATTAEGEAARAIDSAATIFVLNGPAQGSVERLRHAHLTPVINSLAQLELWRATGSGDCALHVDTGMSRLGLDIADCEALAADPGRLRQLPVTLLMTHLACADDPQHPLSADQLKRFSALRSALPDMRCSIGNSAGCLLGAAYSGDLLRPGIALYGGNPLLSGPNPLSPVVRLRARILQTREVPAGTPVSYGATFVTQEPALLATVAIGYADGYPRSLGNCASAVVAGERVPVVGRVTMDTLVVDVTRLGSPGAREARWATLIGDGVTLDEVATLAGTISYEILTGLGRRLTRRYLPAKTSA